MFLHLVKILFFVTALAITFNVPAMDNENNYFQENPPIDLPQLAGIESISLNWSMFRHGNYSYKMNLEDKVLDAWWYLKKKKGYQHETINEQDVENLLVALESLTGLHNDSTCGRTDFEEYISLNYEDRQVKIVSWRARRFSCGDVYVTNKTFDYVKEVLDKTFTQLF